MTHLNSARRRRPDGHSLVALIAALVVVVTLASCAQPASLPSTSATPASAATAAPAAQAAQAANGTQAHIDAARAALKAGKFDQALTEAQAAVKADAQSSEAQYLLGNAYNQLAGNEVDPQKRQDDLSKAVDAYQAAIKLDSKNDAAFTNLATVYYQNGQFDDAQTNVEQALKLRPDDPTSHYVLGTIHLQRDPSKVPDALDKAQAEFEAAIKSDPNMGAAYIGLANVYLFKKDNQKALENAQKGVDLTQDSPSPYSYWALAQAQCNSGDKVNGNKSIEKINSFNPVDPLFKQQVQALAARCK
jgi:tetratricopeptide (TPR) repeat protein